MHESNSLAFEPEGLEQPAVAGTGAAARAAIRAVARGVELTLFCGICLLLPVWPVLAAAIAHDRNDLRRYRTTLLRVIRHILEQWRTHSIARMVAQQLTPASLRRPQRLAGGCTHCGRCCLNRACVFLKFDAQGRSSCRIYGGRVWKRLSCGKYPSDRRDIALYRCPSFRVIRGPGAGPQRIDSVVSPRMDPVALETVNAEFSETTEWSSA